MRPDYLAHTLYRDPVDEKKLAFLVDEVERLGSRDLDVLEVGCGSGNIALPLASLGYRVHATDIDPASIDFARSRNRFPNLRLEVSDAATVEDGSTYDVIIASEILEHLDEPGAALARFKRSLRPSGIVLVTVPNGRGPWELGQAISPLAAARKVARKTGLRRLLGRLRRSRAQRSGETSTFNKESPHVQHFTLASFTELASSCGFRIERRAHSDGPLVFLSPLRHIRPLARFDCRLADRLPPAWASGWYFVLRPGG